MNWGFKKKKPINHGHGLVYVLDNNKFSCFDKKLYLVTAVSIIPHYVHLSVIINHLQLCHISYLYEILFVIQIINNHVKTILMYGNIDHITWFTYFCSYILVSSQWKLVEKYVLA